MNYSIMETQFHGEYRAVFTKALSYLFTLSLQEDYADEKMADLYDLLLTAQTQNTPVERVVGKDTERFVREFFSDYSLMDRLRSVAERIKTLAWIMLIIEMLTICGDEHPVQNFFSIRVNVAAYGVGLLLGMVLLVIHAFLRPTVLRAKKMDSSKWSLVLGGIFIVLMVVSIVLLHDLTFELPAAPIVFGCAAYLIVYYSTCAVLNYRRYGTVQNVRKKLYKDSYYSSLQDKDIDRQCKEAILKGWKKRYAKQIKKGKLTEEQCLDDAKKYERFEKIGARVTDVLFVIIPLLFVWQVARESEWLDTLFFAVLIAAVEFAVWRFFRKIEAGNTMRRNRFLTDCEQRGMTLPAYVEEKLNAPEEDEFADSADEQEETAEEE